MKNIFRVLLSAALLMAINVQATDVTPTSPNGWAPANVRTNATVAITGAQPRSGLGSLEFTTNTIVSGQDKADFEKIWGIVAGRTLGNLSALSYEFYRSSASTTDAHFAPVLRLYYYNSVSGENGLLIWEPIYNGYVSIPTDTWISEDVFADNFWMRAFGPSRTIDDYNVSLAEWMANADEEGSPIDDDADADVPHVLSSSIYITGINVGVGSGWGETFLGYVDNVEIEFGADVETANFELPPPCTTDCYVDATTGNDANGGTNATTDAKKTIQNAVNTVNASGNVHVAAGTYTEQVTVNKSLNLIGADAATTIIKAPATIPAASNVTSTVVDINGSGITVDIGGFTVSGPGPTGCGSLAAGIFVRGGAHADIHDNKILDIRDNPISGCQNGVGIQVGRNLYSTTGTATITNNIISGFQKNGITVDRTGSYAEITGNTVTGAGAVNFIAQNGIQISRGATGDINGNTVSGHSYTPLTAVSTGMLLYQSNANTDDNDVLENQIGIYHIDGSGLHQKNSVSASAAGTGSATFWGIVADPGDVPRAIPDPLDGLTAANNLTQSKQGQNKIAATYTQTYDQNMLTGDGSASGIGLEGDALGTNVLDMTVTANTITGWDKGITFYKDAGATLIANIINCNKIYDNGIGVDNPTGVVVNAVGNWWGDASGPAHASNPGGSGDAISDDVTFTPWGTDASCGTSIGSDLVFHAGSSISIERTKQTPSRGWIHSNGTVTFKRGDPSTYEVDITAVGKVTLVGDENTIDGDVFTASTITNNEGSVITGAAVSGAAISSIALPSLSYSGGTINHTIAKGKSLTLAPGSYGTVTINKTATLKLSSGTYNFAKLLNSGSDATIIFDVSSGPITINVVTSLTIAKDMEFRVLPGGESNSEMVTVNTMQTAKLSLGAESYLLGYINAPNAAVVMGNNTQFRGTLSAKSIEILRDCLWYGHNSTGTLPGPDLLPKFEADDEEVSSELVTSYQLEQNYPNPFNPSTMIRFGLVERGKVEVQIYNHLGQVVRTLANEELAAGWHDLSWDGRNETGDLVATGVYFYRVNVRNQTGATIFSETRSMTFLK